jgi:hypothetical protein
LQTAEIGIVAKLLRKTVEEELSLQKRIDGLHESPKCVIGDPLQVVIQLAILVVGH